MSQASDYLEAKIADLIFGLDTFSAPATMYLALFTAAPNDAGGGTEVTGGSYARAAITNDDTKWDLISGQIENIDIITFATATANWGTATHWSLFDASSGGNMLFHGELTSPATINNGGTYRVGVGGIVINVAAKSNYLRDELLSHIFGLDTFTAPDPVYVRLYTSAPTDSGGGTQVSGGSYAPSEVVNDATTWARTVSTIKNTNASIDYAEATANWGSVVAAAIWDAASGGNLIHWSNLASPQTVNSGSQFGFDEDTFAVSVN